MSLFSRETIATTAAATLPDEVVLAKSFENPSYFELLVERYQQGFLRVALGVVHQKEEAEDIVQEAFVKIYRHGKRYKKQEVAEFRHWAYKVLFNTALNHYRKLKRRSTTFEYLDAFLYDERPDAKSLDFTEEERVFVEQILAKMPPEASLVLRKHYLEDKPYQIIANEQRTTVSAVKMRMFRAKKLFKKASDGTLM